MLQSLPLGRSSFSALRAKSEIYVDKTELIYRLACHDSKIFLARPRRFGKSLLVSTFESLFKFGLRDFRNLAIEKLWKDKTYKVLRLDFSEIKEFTSAEDFERQFYSFVASKFRTVGFECHHEGFEVLIELSNWLGSLEPSSFVILVDEYDAPLTNCLEDKELFSLVRSVTSRLFLTLKANDGCQRFFFMTGITKVSNTSIFSAFNNLQDISLNPVFGTLLGYTEEEIKLYFKDYLVNASKCLGIKEEKVLEQLRSNYDGFAFDMKASCHVYCPWSVLNFFNYPEMGFQNYWYTSGGQPTVLMKFLMHHPLAKPISYTEEQEVRLSELGAARQYDEIGLHVLLTQAGYYTIKSVTSDHYAVLGYPNREVATSMAQLYADALLKGERLRPIGSLSIYDVMEKSSLDDVVAQLNAVVSAIDYTHYPIVDEASLRAYLQVLLIGAAMLPKVENHNALGRSDLEVETETRQFVFELKYARDESQVQPLLNSALEQIQNKRYGANLSRKESIRVALVFDAQNRSFVAWQRV